MSESHACQSLTHVESHAYQRLTHISVSRMSESHAGRVSRRSSVTQVDVEETKDTRVQHCRVASLGIAPCESDVEYLPSREGMVGCSLDSQIY